MIRSLANVLNLFTLLMLTACSESSIATNTPQCVKSKIKEIKKSNSR